MNSLILIAYPKELINFNFFERKVESIIKNQKNFSFLIFDDPNKFVEQKWGGLPNKKIKKKDRAHSRIYAEEATHAIVFWDGHDYSDLLFYLEKNRVPLRKILIETTKVSNKDKGDYYDAYIGRGTPWGNPFPIRENGDDRNEVIEKYRTYFNEKITNDEEFRKGIKSLKGKVLGCHCKPLPCHGDIISNYLNSLDEDE